MTADFNSGVIMGVDLFESFDEFRSNSCHFHDRPDEAVGNRWKGSDEVEEDSRRIGSARDGKLMHVCIHHEDVVHQEATCDALLRQVKYFISNFTESEIEARAKHIADVRRIEDFHIVAKIANMMKAKGTEIKIVKILNGVARRGSRPDTN